MPIGYFTILLTANILYFATQFYIETPPIIISRVNSIKSLFGALALACSYVKECRLKPAPQKAVTNANINLTV